MLSTIGFIITARMSSTRLPGKVLKKIQNKTCLAHLCNRLKQSRYYRKIVVATSVNSDDNAIESEAKNLNVLLYRGNLEDVLGRVTNAALEYDIDPVVLVGGDRAIQDVQILDYVIDSYEQKYHKYDCVVNLNKGRDWSFPQGQVIYVIGRSFLEKASKVVTDKTEREQLHLILLEEQLGCKTLSVNAPPIWNRPDIRTAIDTQDDFRFNQMLFEKLYAKDPCFSIEDVICFLNNDSKLPKTDVQSVVAD